MSYILCHGVCTLLVSENQTTLVCLWEFEVWRWEITEITEITEINDRLLQRLPVFYYRLNTQTRFYLMKIVHFKIWSQTHSPTWHMSFFTLVSIWDCLWTCSDVESDPPHSFYGREDVSNLSLSFRNVDSPHVVSHTKTSTGKGQTRGTRCWDLME